MQKWNNDISWNLSKMINAKWIIVMFYSFAIILTSAIHFQSSDWQKEQLDSSVRLDPAVNCTVLGPSGWVAGAATVDSPWSVADKHPFAPVVDSKWSTRVTLKK